MITLLSLTRCVQIQMTPKFRGFAAGQSVELLETSPTKWLWLMLVVLMELSMLFASTELSKLKLLLWDAGQYGALLVRTLK